MKKYILVIASIVAASTLMSCTASLEHLSVEKSTPVEEQTPLPSASEESVKKEHVVMVEDKLYYDTGKESTLKGRCGVMDGQITSSVDSSEVPTQNNQSNFGSGYGFQYGTEDTIEISIDGKWVVFKYHSGDEEKDSNNKRQIPLQ